MTNLGQKISFSKMQGAGNDFIVLDNRRLNLLKDEIIELAPKICDRNFGIGADGIITLLEAEKKNTDYTMFYRNADGSDAGMCGNGARCMALFARSQGFGKQQAFNVHDQTYEAIIEGPNSVSVAFPMQASIEKTELHHRPYYFIHTGTEHLVTTVDETSLEDEDTLRKEGKELRYEAKFQPLGTNANFISGKDECSLKLQTYERGVEDLTLACGTGAIASALVWHHLQKVKPSGCKYEVETKGGSLFVYFSFDPETKNYSNIKLEGPAHFVFKGEYSF
jgi:diaminopimelate epimerase